MKKLTILIICVFTISIVYSKDKENKVKPILIVMDIQNEFLPGMDQEEAELGLKYINAYIELFRKHHLPIIRVYHQRKNGIPHQDSLAFQFPESISITDDDPMVIKNYPSAFTKTNLHDLIEQLGGNTLFICGLSATGCALATYTSCWDYEYNAFFLKNAIISHNSKYTDQIEEIFRAVNYDIVEILIESIP